MKPTITVGGDATMMMGIGVTGGGASERGDVGAHGGAKGDTRPSWTIFQGLVGTFLEVRDG